MGHETREGESSGIGVRTHSKGRRGGTATKKNDPRAIDTEAS